MKASITGDIVQSQGLSDPAIWLNPLEQLLKEYGESPGGWEIYRGDSFQLEISPKDALRCALIIKSLIKKLKKNTLDVRVAIGIGEKRYTSSHVSRSAGDAFLFSGRLLDQLKKEKIHLGIKTPWSDFDAEFNLIFRLALIIMNNWTSNSAEVAELMLKNTKLTQQDIANKLGLAQSTVNDRIKRASLYEIMEMVDYYEERISAILKQIQLTED
jgi:hypothetical protein